MLLVPLKLSAPPYLPCVDHVAPVIVPVLPLPDDVGHRRARALVERVRRPPAPAAAAERGRRRGRGHGRVAAEVAGRVDGAARGSCSVVDGVRPVSLKLVAVGVPIWAKFVQPAPWQRSTR